MANPHSSNQAYFVDYDRDGDLDVFLLTHNVKRTSYLDVQGTRKEMEKEDPVSGVRFYRNDDGHFTDVTKHVGISSSSLTYGLGAGISDIDKDGWIDIYAGNDYSPPDYLYMNRGDGTFSDELGLRIGHTPHASMGVDVADINNDGWPDIIVVDMLAEDNRRQKTLLIPNDRSVFEIFVRSGFHHQYMRNMLPTGEFDMFADRLSEIVLWGGMDWYNYYTAYSTLNYSTSFGGVHNLAVMAGASVEKSTSEGLEGSRGRRGRRAVGGWARLPQGVSHVALQGIPGIGMAGNTTRPGPGRKMR